MLIDNVIVPVDEFVVVIVKITSSPTFIVLIFRFVVDWYLSTLTLAVVVLDWYFLSPE